jgi:Leucine-rich repeat (LRR) protein
LANNSITSICAGSTAAMQSSTAAHGTGHPPSGYSSSSCNSSGSLGFRLSGLSSWLVGLQVLRLPGNQLRDLAGLEGCSSLTQLDVSRNQLTCLRVRVYDMQAS